MSTFDGYVKEFPRIRIDRFVPLANRPAPTACFLSHIHTDHLHGLEAFRGTFIYCSPATAQLLPRIQRRAARLDLAAGLGPRRITYGHLRPLLRPIPLGTPTDVELGPGRAVRVTLFDADHCPGAVMFLLEGAGRAVLYTGDVRCEGWFVERLVREPVMLPYARGLRTLDCIYLDTTFGRGVRPTGFVGKADGLQELLEKAAAYPEDTVFYFHAWTYGYEEALVGLAAFLGTKVHVDDYKWRLYSGLEQGEHRDLRESAPLTGFRNGHSRQMGCFTNEDGEGVRIHCCERGMECDIFKKDGVVSIIPLITRYRGIEYAEPAMGGGGGDLEYVEELDETDMAALGHIMALCCVRFKKDIDRLQEWTDWLITSIEKRGRNVALDLEAFHQVVPLQLLESSEEIPRELFEKALQKLIVAKESGPPLGKTIKFPWSRHASYDELCALVGRFRPREVFPNTDSKEDRLDMKRLYGAYLYGAVQDEHDGSEAGGEAHGTEETPRPETEQRRSDPSSQDRASADSHMMALQTPKSRATSTTAEGRKRRAHGGLDAAESVRRRRAAYNAAMNPDRKGWTEAVDLISVKGYHNEEDEIEL